ncbi:RagB/SusD family nutrient uptake outer membrane protein [Pedobacter nototheniae]|uniref:RagB/SusD family nutrient uptake outer membrane protein n=1 Tax=Pedobacter nototheniae TaxID=2488994 RepID=UPI00103971BC|nr:MULTISPECIES: RagB/SusD family nutrient uptake outer membrane protein [Pedobacter]
MKNFNIKYTSLVVVTTLILSMTVTSCKKAIEIDPVDYVNSETALSSKAGIDAGIVTAYALLKGEVMYGNRMIGLGEALSDNGRSTNRSGRYVSEAVNSSGSHYSNWTTSYYGLNLINQILEAIPNLNVTGVTDATKASWIGELKFLRALYHFDLVKEYAYIPGAVVAAQDRGGVPIISKSTTTADAALATKSSRNSLTEVYDFIYSDLTDAVSKLSDIGSSPSRANKQAAQALFSRVALYRKDWANVIAYSTPVITSRGSTLLTSANYVTGWTSAVNPESLFEVTFAASGESLGVNVSLQTLFTSLKVRGDRTQKGGYGDLVPTNDLVSKLGITVTNNGSTTAAITARSSDVRNQLFELGATAYTTAYIECTKFLGRSGAINLDNVPVIRISEAYLNRAEAYYFSGNEPLALADVNKIRTNRGLTASTATGTALWDEILLQRRLEFAFEGQRFMDLKRNGLDIYKPVSGVTVAFTNFVILPSIPTNDVDASSGNLKQNYGY